MRLIVQFFIPEDNDSEENPNVYFIHLQQNQTEVSLRTIKKYFPLPGEYHFSVKTLYRDIVVWYDLVKNDQMVSVSKEEGNSIMLKVHRLRLVSSVNNNHKTNVNPRDKFLKQDSGNLLDFFPDGSDLNNLNPAVEDFLNLAANRTGNRGSVSSVGSVNLLGGFDSININAIGANSEENGHGQNRSSSPLVNLSSPLSFEVEAKPLTNQNNQNEWTEFMKTNNNVLAQELGML